MRRVLFLVVLLSVIGAAPAHAYNAPGPRWSGDTIRYADTLPKAWNWSIDQAVRTWNRSGADIRFRKVPRHRADVVIGYGNLGSAAGLATIGRYSGAFVRVNSLLYRPLRERDRTFAAQVLAHELGHVLGLGHVRSDNCRLMSTPPLTYCPQPPQPWLYDCQWLSRDDIRGVVHLYGRRKDRPPVRQYCLREPRPRAPKDVVIGSRITWTPVTVRPGTRVVITTYDPARCAGDTASPARSTAEVPMRRGHWTDPAAGAHCYEIRSVNKFGMTSEGSWGIAVPSPRDRRPGART